MTFQHLQGPQNLAETLVSSIQPVWNHSNKVSQQPQFPNCPNLPRKSELDFRVRFVRRVQRTFAIIFKSPWQNFTKTSESLVVPKMSILCKNQEVSMCQSRDITWNTRKYREISQNLRTLAITFEIPWQNFTKTSESLVVHKMNILCKNQEVSMCQSRDITWNTRKYREISQNLRTLAIIFEIPWQNFTKSSESLVVHEMNILCKNQKVFMCQSWDITWNTRKYREISQNLRTLAITFEIPWQNFTKTSESLVVHKINILCKNQEVSMCQSRDITWNTRKYREISQNLRTLAIIFEIPWQNFTKSSESLVVHEMNILCKNQKVFMCQSWDITWNTRKYREISQNLRTLAITFEIPWQNFTKTSESLVVHKINILCKNQEVSMCQSRDITWNTRKYREISQNLRTLAIIFEIPWQNFTKTSESLVVHEMNILCKNQKVFMCQSWDITWNTRKYREISQNLRTLAITFEIPWQNFTKTSESLVVHKINILCKNQEVSMCQSRDITWNTRKYREISQNLRTLAIIFEIPWQNFTKTSESLVVHEMNILCKNQKVFMCQSWDITWNTRKYREISQNLRTLAITFEIPWQNFTKTSESLVVH